VDSSEICKLFGSPLHGWQEWISGNVRVPRKSRGVYVIRIAGGKTIGRFEGQSDVIYIGCGIVSRRLKQHSGSRMDLQDKSWQLTLMARNMKLEVGFFPSENPKEDETQLIGNYFISHLELPPANRRLQLSRDHKAQLILSGLLPDKPLSALKQISLAQWSPPNTKS